MQRHEFTSEQINGPKNILGYPELPWRETQAEVPLKKSETVFEASSPKNSSHSSKKK
jgi:hypothetical protein